MTLRNRIRSWIDRFQNRKFRDSVKEEKKRNYLFQKKKESFQSVRLKLPKKQEPLLKPFSSLVRNIKFEQGNPYALTIWFIGIILIGLCFYIIFFSSYFRISPSRVIISSQSNTVDINLAYKALEHTYGTFIFSVDIEKIKKNLTDLQKHIEHIEIARLYPNGLKVIITPYPTVFETRISFLEKDFLLTENGILVPDMKRWESNFDQLEIVSRTLLDELFLDYKEAITPHSLSGILIAKQTLTTEFPDLWLWLFRYFPNERELHISLESGTRILLSLDETVKNTIKNELLTFRMYALTHREELQKWRIIYIDARTVGKLFICREQKICQKNLGDIYGDIYR